MQVLFTIVRIHEWVAHSGVLEKLLKGDTNLCAIVGIVAGGIIGWNQMKQRQRL